MSSLIGPRPFQLVKFSGGRSSAMMAIQGLRSGRFGGATAFLFNNTSAEHPATYEFIAECDRFMRGEHGARITCVEWRVIDGEKSFAELPIDKLCADGSVYRAMVEREDYLPNVFGRNCTKELKVMTTRRWLAKAFPKGDFTAYMGIRADEIHRTFPIRDKALARENVAFPLVEAGITKADVIRFWDAMPFDLPKDFEGKGNCTYCFLKSPAQLGHLAATQPSGAVGAQRIEWWIDLESSSERGFSFWGEGKTGSRLSFALIKSRAKEIKDAGRRLGGSLPCDCTD